MIMLARWEGPEAGAQLDEILPLYEEIYAEPPYQEGPREVADFLDRFHKEQHIPGFRLVIARDGTHAVGFAFGFRLSSDTTWWDGLLEPRPKEFTHETGERTFAVIELAVRKPWRRRGIAARLHTELLDGTQVERATLTMRPEPEAAPAQSAYAAWGYVKVGQSQPWDEAPAYDSMVLKLR
jgi:GNAT superfamily N-acetyltransferase